MKLQLLKCSRWVLVAVVFAILPERAQAQQNVGIGTKSPAADAVLELRSNNQGFLVPRLNAVQRNSIVASSNGLLVFDTDSALFLRWSRVL